MKEPGGSARLPTPFYLAVGNRSSLLSTVSYPNGAVADYRYDDARRVTQVSNRLNGAVASRYDYTYDRNGNRLSQQETNGGAVETTTYVYDNNDRLTRADYSDATLDYGYDAAYNRTGETAVEKAGGTTVSSKTFSYNNRNQVTSISDSANAANDTTYSYDANGNQTVKTRNGHTLTFVYDVRDRLVRVSQDTTTLGQFRYDHAGMRIQKEGAQGIVRYTYDDGSVLLQTDDTGATLAKYDYGPDRLLSLEQVTEGEQFYHFDALGSVVNLSRPDGSLQARYQYDAWGNERASTGSSWNRFAFTGHEKDEETGLYYFKARFYDPQVGRFLSQDGYLGETNTPPSLHRYLYAYANPTVYVDLYGYEATPWYHQYVNEETDVWETKGETYDTGSDIKDAYLATVDTVNNVLKTAGNEVMAITALPESSWAAAKGWAQDRNVSLREATGDFDSTIGAIPIVSAIRPSNIPRMLRQVFGKPARQAARLAEEGRGGLKAAGEVSDLPPVPELRKANSSITIEGSKMGTVQVPASSQAHGQITGVQKDKIRRVSKRNDNVPKKERASNRLLLGRQKSVESRSAKGRGLASSVDSDDPKTIFKKNYSDMRRAEEIEFDLSGVPSNQSEIGSKFEGGYSRAEELMIRSRQDLLKKTDFIGER